MPAGNVDFTFNEDWFEEVLRSAPVQAKVLDRASRIAAKAKATAPRDSGQYADSIHLETKNADKREVVQVVASARHSMAVEAKHGTLARANKAVRK